ncbi:MAG TPA: M56 family metallopeptidase, partial [Vicinamibacterales bacterium]
MSPWTHLVGWTLIHFVWQGAALALGAAGALRLWRHRSANARYAIACGALAAMLAAPVLTARVLLASGAAPAADVGQQQPNAVTGPLSPAPRTWRDDGGMAVSAMRAAGVDDPLPAVVFVWITGVALLTVRLAGGVWRVRRLQVVSLAADASLWQAAADRMASRLGLRSTIHVVESSLVDAPAALGWLRPVILLPLAGFASLTPAQVEAILAHELIHIRRHDFLVNLAQTVAETLLFFHPGVWWVSARIREEREYCCDDVAVAVCGDVVDYAAALAELEACRSRGTALALAATGGSLVGRVRRILQLPVADEDRSLGWIGTLGLALLVAGGMSGIQLSSVGSDDGGVLLADSAQEPIVAPNTFDWQVQRTEHFEIHYYAALTPVLERVADAAERAYQRVSSELRYDLPFTVPLILFKTRSEFE